jgi:hypothetical protein
MGGFWRNPPRSGLMVAINHLPVHQAEVSWTEREVEFRLPIVGFVSKMVSSRLGLRNVFPIQVKGLRFSRDIYFARNKRRVAISAQTIFWDFVTGDQME